MSAEKLLNVGPSGIEVTYERFGDVQAPPVLLIMGLGAQMLGWNEGFCDGLVARGLQAIRFDNRDVGLSSHFPDAPAPDLAAAISGDTSSASYTLSDMAADTIGLLDALGLDSAHIVGASMGGMIAQTIAVEYPNRVRSLTSMMSTTGDRSVGQPKPKALGALAGPTPMSREDVMNRAVAAFRVVGHQVSSSMKTKCVNVPGVPTTSLRPARSRASGGRGHRIWRQDGATSDGRRTHTGNPWCRRSDVRRQRRASNRRCHPGCGASGDRRHGPRPAACAVAPNHLADREPRPARRGGFAQG